MLNKQSITQKLKGQRSSNDLRYGGKNSISTSALIFAVIGNKLGIHIFHTALLYSAI